MDSWSLGNSNTNKITFELLSPTAKDEGYKWVNSRIKIIVGGFSGSFGANLLANEFTSFRKQLRAVYENLDGKAVFSTIEDQIEVIVELKKNGHVTVSGYVIDQAGTGNKLTFRFEIDQTFLPRTIGELNEIVSKYDV